MPAALKVYRMAVGFHDAYVAAPSQKAAAAAWGADTDVFRRGEAELVTDPALTAQPLARPGEVVKRLRGTAAEQIAALGKSDAPKAEKAKRAAPKPQPKPSRAALKAAERAVAEAAARHKADRRALAEREAALARQRAAAEQRQAAELVQLRARQDEAEADYSQALRRWRG